MIKHSDISDIDLHRKIKTKEIRLGGNKTLKIYGLLTCQSGKRMKRENRVFFISAKQAQQHNYRPCGHCLKNDYRAWKNGLI